MFIYSIILVLVRKPTIVSALLLTEGLVIPDCFYILTDLDVNSICVHICDVGSGFSLCVFVVWMSLFLLVTMSVVKEQMQIGCLML